MKITFVVNDIKTEKDDYSTTRLALRAVNMGHEVSLVSLDDFSYNTDECVHADAYLPSAKSYENDLDILNDLQSAEPQQINLSRVDVILLRADPADELEARPWAPSSSLLFAQLACLQGVIVLNDPFKLTDASNKTYFQEYPEIIRPRTCITRNERLIKEFIEKEGGKAVIKPLQGSGGQGVFIINEESGANVNQMIEATIKDGYAIVQEYLPKAKDGDLRLITLNGKPLQVDGVYACCHRFSQSDDGRSNISAGGGLKVVAPDADALRIAEIASPKLMKDGMYLAGLDIVGDKMMEINVDSPGALNFLEDLTDVDFSGAIIEDLHRKVELKKHYKSRLNHRDMAII